MPKPELSDDSNNNTRLNKMSSDITNRLEENTFTLRETTYNMISIIKK